MRNASVKMPPSWFDCLSCQHKYIWWTSIYHQIHGRVDEWNYYQEPCWMANSAGLISFERLLVIYCVVNGRGQIIGWVRTAFLRLFSFKFINFILTDAVSFFRSGILGWDGGRAFDKCCFDLWSYMPCKTGLAY